ncbi:tRNA uridine-5-carboxymethylaminomethyl(34) synthesis GTPase MnmE, partial [bacterium]|nr:tRNA uridine-5-carboxymethylaminomethyl(34) synthesis GTPase MnmE [bacterium]
MENNFDTICAIITPIAVSAVSIIRLSGDKSFEIANSIFSKKIVPKMINYGHIKDNNAILDEVIVLPFVSPHSYTGEDVIEIQTHGNPVIVNSILELILSKGARLATRGEFTKRAFLNHRIDLSQAEAVLDIISSKSVKSAQNALSNLGGYLKSKIDKTKDDLIQLYSKVIASIDFPEDVADVDK